MKRIHVKIFGDVHGVGFRHYTQHRARKLGIKGWVKNNADDKTVEAVFEGEAQQVDDMVEFCKRGPPNAYVEHVEVSEEIFKNEFDDFTII